jgi:hypothetical protein
VLAARPVGVEPLPEEHLRAVDVADAGRHPITYSAFPQVRGRLSEAGPPACRH